MVPGKSFCELTGFVLTRTVNINSVSQSVENLAHVSLHVLILVDGFFICKSAAASAAGYTQQHAAVALNVCDPRVLFTN